MCWIEEVQGVTYERLLTNLLSYSDTVQCIMREEDDTYFEPILTALVEKKYVTDWPLTKLGRGVAPVLQYTFRYTYEVVQFLKDRQSSFFSWLMPHPEDWSFWQGNMCLLATCSHEQMLDMSPEVETYLSIK